MSPTSPAIAAEPPAPARLLLRAERHSGGPQPLGFSFKTPSPQPSLLPVLFPGDAFTRCRSRRLPNSATFGPNPDTFNIAPFAGIARVRSSHGLEAIKLERAARIELAYTAWE